METLLYNTQRTPLIIPEYGRHVQIMINQIMETKEREERNKMASAVIGIMGNMNPHLRDVPDFQHKLWDQLFIMSNFGLDVDCPFEKPLKEVLEQKPGRLSYPQKTPEYRFYGNNIKSMITFAMGWEDGDLKNALILNIANHMKKCFLNWNKDTVDDEVIFGHLAELSGGKIVIDAKDEVLSASENLIRLTNKRFAKGSRSNTKNHKYRNQKQRRK